MHRLYVWDCGEMIFGLRCKLILYKQFRLSSQIVHLPGTAHRRRSANHRHSAIHPGSCTSEKAKTEPNSCKTATAKNWWDNDISNDIKAMHIRNITSYGCFWIRTYQICILYIYQMHLFLPRCQLKPAGHGLICFSFSRMACCLACSKRTRSSSSQNLKNLQWSQSEVLAAKQLRQNPQNPETKFT